MNKQQNSRYVQTGRT